MKLFLASEAKNSLTVPKLKEFVGGFEGKKLAYIPTASNLGFWGDWKTGGSWALVQTLGADLTVMELESYAFKSPVEDLKDKDIIWFAGGSVSYLMFWLIHTGLVKDLKSLLDNGAMYVGSSAGSMVTAPDISIGEWYIGEREPEAQYLPGLGLVDFDIYPHFQDDLKPQIEKLYQGQKMYLLKDGEEILVEDTKVTVIGEERIIP